MQFEDLCLECGSELGFDETQKDGYCYQCYCLNHTDEEVEDLDKEIAARIEEKLSRN